MASTLESLQNNDLAEEMEAINAIYDPDTLTVSSTPASKSSLKLGNATPSTVETTAKLQLPNQAHLSFVLGFEASYPDTPPRVLGTASTGSRGEGKIAVDVVGEVIQRVHQAGAVCLFDVINEAVEAFEELNLGGGQEAAVESEGEAEDNQAESTNSATGRIATGDAFGLDRPPEWILSEVATEKKSVFLGRAASVSSLEQAQGFLDHLLATEKKVAGATHNISAWRIRQSTGPRGETTVQDFDDDGETAAGGRLLHLMQLMDVWDVVVVVSRWYGGVKLGPDRFRLINAAGKDALVKGGYTREETNGSEKGKKKGKR